MSPINQSSPSHGCLYIDSNDVKPKNIVRYRRDHVAVTKLNRLPRNIENTQYMDKLAWKFP